MPSVLAIVRQVCYALRVEEGGWAIRFPNTIRPKWSPVMETKLKSVPVPDTTGPVRYPTVVAQLSGGDGNVFAVIGRVTQAMRRAFVSKDEISAFRSEVMKSESYDHALACCMKWVDCQ